jgi:hypothetical protein
MPPASRTTDYPGPGPAAPSRASRTDVWTARELFRRGFWAGLGLWAAGLCLLPAALFVWAVLWGQMIRVMIRGF